MNHFLLKSISVGSSRSFHAGSPAGNTTRLNLGATNEPTTTSNEPTTTTTTTTETTVMKPLWYLGFILVLECFSVFIFQDLRAFQQLEFNYII